MEKLATLITIFLLAMLIGHCINEGFEEVDAWFQKLLYAKEKVTKFRFFFHDRFVGKNITSVQVAHATSTAKSTTNFGLVFIMDDPLIEGLKPISKELGRAQGLYTFFGREELSLLMAMNLVFTSGENNGSTLIVLGRNPMVPHREFPIIGGSSVFRLDMGLRR